VLPDDVLRWVGDVTGAAPVRTQELAGATSSSVFGITLDDRTQVVLRLHTNDAWLAREPDLASREATALRALAISPIVAPALIAVDETGALCGRPAVLMTKLRGEPSSDISDSTLRSLAEALPALHAEPVPDGLPPFAPYQEVSQRSVPAWTSIPDVWNAAIAVCASPSPSSPTVFIHRDYHPGNVLFDDERLTGIVDWVNACAGPAEIDIAHCRLNIALAHGLEAADEFAALASSLYPDADPQCQAYWDLVDCLDFATPEADETNPRMDEYLRAALGRWQRGS
jgi:aminoglycoside phosphotransferase (APT) family kinase protein